MGLKPARGGREVRFESISDPLGRELGFVIEGGLIQEVRWSGTLLATYSYDGGKLTDVLRASMGSKNLYAYGRGPRRRLRGARNG